MARIPDAVRLLQSGKPQDLQKLLIAAILHSEEEMLIVTDSELRAAANYALVTQDIAEENSVVLTVRPR